jgi:peptidoglycan/xylan/chitin deacetylase (PgdA/CDA1 family)
MALSWIEQKILGFFVKTNGLFSQPYFGGLGCAFMLHRIQHQEQRDQFPFNNGLSITPEKLEEHILYFKRKGFEFLSLTEVQQIIEQKIKPKKRFVVFTLDDGYEDNFTLGLPLFEKYQVPFAVYVTTGFTNKTAFPWWYLLENTLQVPGKLTLTLNGTATHYEWNPLTNTESMYHELAGLFKKYDTPQTRTYLRSLFDEKKIQCVFDKVVRPADWNMLNDIKTHPLVTLGAHTCNHFRLSGLDFQDAKTELLDSKKELEDRLGINIEHFAYPYGGLEDVSSKDIALAAQIGFKTAALNFPGAILADKKSHLMCLPRFPLGEKTNTHKLQENTRGITHFGTNGFKSIHEHFNR